MPKLFDDRTHVFHQFTIRITKDFPISRESLIKRFEKNEIRPKIYYSLPLHKQKLYKDLGYKSSLPVSERAAKEVLSLPVHPSLARKDLEKVVKILSL